MPQDPESSEITTRPPIAAIAAAGVQPPSRVYLGVDDRLYIRSRNSVTAVTLQIAGRLLTAEGVIVPFNFEHVPATDRTATLQAFRLAEGYLLSVVVFPSVGAPQRGQTFVEIGLLRGRDVAASVVDVLARDYVAEAEPLAFPGMPIRSSLEGPGALRSITGTDPAVDTEISETVPTDARWRVHSIQLRLVTDANAASRVVVVTFDDGTTVYARTPSNGTQVASTGINYYLGEHGNQGNRSPADGMLPIGRIFMSAGDRIRTLTTNLQAGDNFTAPQLRVEEWIED